METKATEHGKGNEYNHRVLEAFFLEGQDISQIDVLMKLAGKVGLKEKSSRRRCGPGNIERPISRRSDTPTRRRASVAFQCS